MGKYQRAFGPHDPDNTYVAHSFVEQLFDTGEVHLNYATAGDAGHSALLLIPGQTESWWGYEKAIPLLAERFQVFAVDLRGQGRSDAHAWSLHAGAATSPATWCASSTA